MPIDIPNIDDILRKNKFRATPQRRTIYRALWDAGSHPTVAEVRRIAQERDPTISLATVYKTLELFAKIGIVREMGFRDESTRYDPEPQPHINLICTGCGKVEDYDMVDISTITPKIEKDIGFDVLRYRFEVYGLCTSCQRKQNR